MLRAAANTHLAPHGPLATLAASLLLAILAFRTTTAFDPFPAWSSDPLLVASPVVAITPALGLGLDIASILLAALLLAALAPRNLSPRGIDIALLSTGAVGIILHALILPTRTLDDLLLGATWLSALCSAFALAQAARMPRVRALVGGTLAALLVAFALRSCVQVFVDHPQTLAMFRQTRAEFFASQGWTEGSAMALAYERRLTQAEGSAWFGLANILATTAAATLTLALGLLTIALRPADPDQASPAAPRVNLHSGPLVPLMLLAALSLAALILAGSKGGYAAAALGAALIAIAHIAPRLLRPPTTTIAHRAASLFGPALIALALGAVALRGLVGERLGELSLLFRWFYIEAAASITAQHPVLGVGPAGFKDAYLLAKSPISPEDVSSPHSVLFDYAATLGIPGLALGALLLLWSSRAGRTLLVAPTRETSPSTPTDWAVTAVPADTADTAPIASQLRTPLLAILALATASSGYIEQPMATVEGTLMRLLALALGLWIALAVARNFFASPRVATVALAGAGLVAFTHTQIELTAVHPNAAMWLFITLALAAAPCPTHSNAPSAAPSRAARLAGPASGVIFLLLAIALATALPNVARWQQRLLAAERVIAPVREARQLLDLASASRSNTAALGELRVLLSREAGRPALGSSPPELVAAFMELRTSRLHLAMEDLAEATELQPTHFATRRAASTLALQLAEATAGTPAPSAEWSARALQLSTKALTAPVPSASAWSWIAVVQTSTNALSGVPTSQARLAAIADAWLSASNLAPFDPEFAYQAALALDAAGRAEQASTFARRALSNHENYRLDPLQQLNPAELATLRARFPTPPT